MIRQIFSYQSLSPANDPPAGRCRPAAGRPSAGVSPEYAAVFPAGSRARRVAGTEKAVEYGREIDFVEAKDNHPEAFECEPNPKKMDGGGPEFRDACPDCPIHVVSPRNCRSYFPSESPH